ncbi:MAG: hypothetical protein RLY20_1443 [Verrucomicrobiota bacterium]|jgi:ribosomal protein S18 acetylase RimI-like enzyme
MSKPKVILRPLKDAEEARFCAAFISNSEPWLTLGFIFDQAVQRLTNPDREVFVATVDGQIVGALVLDLAGLLNGYVQILAVAPSWRSQGIGQQIVAWAEERIFRQSPNVFLCVSSFNHQAQQFYLRLGYQNVGELPDLLVNGHSEILMRKTRGPLLAYPPATK